MNRALPTKAELEAARSVTWLVRDPKTGLETLVQRVKDRGTLERERDRRIRELAECEYLLGELPQPPSKRENTTIWLSTPGPVSFHECMVGPEPWDNEAYGWEWKFNNDEAGEVWRQMPSEDE